MHPQLTDWVKEDTNSLSQFFWTHVKFSLHLFWAVRNGVWHFWEFAGSSFKVPTPCQTNFCLWGRLSHGVRVKKSKVKTLFWADLTISPDTKECLHLFSRIHKFRIIDDTKCIWKKNSHERVQLLLSYKYKRRWKDSHGFILKICTNQFWLHNCYLCISPRKQRTNLKKYFR